jgi:vancomycin resistance protein YoaR
MRPLSAVHRVRNVGLVALAALALVLLGTTVGWAVDGRAQDGRALKNTTLASRQIGGMDAAAVRRIVSAIGAGYDKTKIVVEADDGGFTATAAELGVTIDVDKTVSDALETGKGGSLLGRVFGWAMAKISDRDAPVRVSVDQARAYDVIRARDRGSKESSVEPSIAYEDGAFVTTPGRPGRGIDPARLAAAIADAAESGDRELHVHVERGTVQPRFTIDDANRLADQAAELTRKGLRVSAGDESATVSTSTLRSWVRAEPQATALTLAIDSEEAAADLDKLLPKAGEAPVDATFKVGSDGVILTPSKSGTECCDASVGARVLAALSDRTLEPVELPLKEVLPDRTEEEARALGIKEQVGSFTTKHACCEARVKNIHRIADIVRGAIIEPGATFSINDFVGKRTTDKGFVVAGVIEEGKFTEDVGGGISQFATTLFNAAFFAGLEFGEYQSHSIRISRYPTGREATMGYPHPDLQIKNVTPHGILIWTGYSSTGITVTLYSTKYFESVSQTGQTTSKSGSCTVYRTERTRVRDGERKVDYVRATYRAAEGVNCRDPYPPPSSSPKPTTPGSSTTTPSGGSTVPPTTAPPPTTEPE